MLTKEQAIDGVESFGRLAWIEAVAPLVAELADADAACRTWAGEYNAIRDEHGEQSGEVFVKRKAWDPLWARREAAIEALYRFGRDWLGGGYIVAGQVAP